MRLSDTYTDNELYKNYHLMFARSIYLFILLCLISLASCKENPACLKFAQEVYPTQQIDTVLARHGLEYHDTLLNRFNETPIKGLPYKAYHLLYYNAFRYGKSIKIEINHEGCFLTIKCLGEAVNESNCENFYSKIREEEWNQFEEMIYEFFQPYTFSWGKKRQSSLIS